jgi:predicted PurR-regulated permease PerM
LALLVAAGLLVWALKAVLLFFAIVFLLAIVLNPMVAFLERKGLKRGFGVALLLLTGASALVLALLFLIPTLLDQVGDLLDQVPRRWVRLRSLVATLGYRYPEIQHVLRDVDKVVNGIGEQPGQLTRILVQSAFNLVGGVLGIVFGALALTFVLLEPEPLVACYLALVPDRHREGARRTLVRLMAHMAAWARGVVINGLAMGVSTGVALALIGVQPAFIFGVIAFLGEFVPIIGPILGSVPALLVALSLGLGKFAAALAAFLVIQQVEQNLPVPFIFGQEMNLHPVSIPFFTMAMGSLFGLAGMVLAVPAAAFFKIALEEFYLGQRAQSQPPIEAEAKRIVRPRAGQPK